LKTKEEISNGMVVLDSNSITCRPYNSILRDQEKELGFKSLMDDPLP